MSWLKTWAPLAIGAFAFACGVDQVGGPAPADDGGSAPLPDTLSATIGPDGGVMRIRGVELSVPAGALERETLLTLANLGDEATSKLASLDRELRYLARPTAFTPHGQLFQRPVQVRMTADVSSSGIVVRRLADEADLSWEIVDSVGNEQRLEFNTSRFSIYALTSSAIEGTGGLPLLGSGGKAASTGGFSFGGSSIGGTTSGGASASAGGYFGGEAGALSAAGSPGEG